MSDFSLPKIAPYLEKDGRTIRRWCEKGLIPSAWKTQGGHWRISAPSLAEAVQQTMCCIPENARRRKENAYPNPLVAALAQATGKTPRTAWQEREVVIEPPPLRKMTQKQKATAILDAALLIENIEERDYNLRLNLDLMNKSMQANLPVENWAEHWGEYPVFNPKKDNSVLLWKLSESLGCSPRTIQRHIPQWRRILKSGFRSRLYSKKGEQNGPTETWYEADRLAFYEGVDSLLKGGYTDPS